MAFKIVVHPLIEQEFGERIRAAAPDVELVRPVEGGWSAELADVEAAYFSNQFFRGDLHASALATFAELPRLRWLHTFQTGVDHPLFDRMLERGVAVSTSVGALSPAMAQYVIAMMLRIIKKLGALDEAQRGRQWAPQRANELTDKTVGIIGVGQIGEEVARLCKAFNMTTLGLRRSDRPSAHVDEILPPARLHELLERSDFVVVAATLNAETRGMIDEAALRKMRKTAWLINVSRALLVDQPAMMRALQEGWIGGACLDVFEVEPLPADSPLWAMPNVIVTPHNSPGGSPLCVERATKVFLENLPRLRAGQPLVNQLRRSVADAIR